MWNLPRTALVAFGFATMALPALAQSANPACQRLEAQLAALDRGSTDPGRAEQVRRYEDAVNKQQFELDKLVAQQRRMGCERGFFSSMFGGGNQQCEPLEQQIDRMRGNLDRMQAELQQLSGNNLQRGGQRRGIIMALADNNCGPQYRMASQGGQGFFDALFGGNGSLAVPEQASTGGRTICVRTCDGYYFPANGGRGGESDQVCQRQCPAAEVALYTQRAGEDVGQAVSTSGQPYSALPAAFKYRQQFDPSCSCRKTGQSWADALKAVEDTTVEQGDIVVNEERAKKLSQPPSNTQGRGKPGAQLQPEAKAEITGSTTASDAEKPKGPVRNVGTPFITR